MTKFSPLLHLACVVPPWEHIQNKDCSFSQGPRWYEQIHSSLSAGHRAVVNFWPSQNVNEKDVLLCSCCYLEEKAMAPHSSTLAWQIPWTEEPGGLQSMRSLRVGHDWAGLHFDFSLSCIGEGNGNPLQYSCLENLRDGGAWWAAIYGVTQSRTRLKWLSSGSSCYLERVVTPAITDHPWRYEQYGPCKVDIQI